MVEEAFQAAPHSLNLEARPRFQFMLLRKVPVEAAVLAPTGPVQSTTSLSTLNLRLFTYDPPPSLANGTSPFPSSGRGLYKFLRYVDYFSFEKRAERGDLQAVYF